MAVCSSWCARAAWASRRSPARVGKARLPTRSSSGRPRCRSSCRNCLLKAGAVVLCDRYIYTAFARDVARGMDPLWVRELYSFAVKPTVAFYFRVPLDVAMKRLLDARDGFKYYEAGMDMGFSEDPEESFEIFQGKILGEYEKMVPEFDITAIDATLPIEDQQVQMRQIVKAKLAQARRLRVAP